MGGLLLSRSVRQLLEEICHSSLWEYAIFWKLNRRGCMVLTWEEGYSKNSNPSTFLENKEGVELCNHPSSASEMGVRNIQAGHPIGLEISKMSSNLYSLGNGIIGNVAFTGEHQWLSFTGLNSKALEEYPDEWQHQFAVGIKTILLVPVGSHGVVHLGSFQSFEEDMLIVADIKDLFHSYDNSGGLKDITSNGGDDLRIYTKSHLSMTEEMEGDTEQISENRETTSYYSISLPPVNKGHAFVEGDVQDFSGMDMHLPFGNSWDGMCDFSSIGPTEEPFYLGGCYSIDDSLQENLLFTFSRSNGDDPNLITGFPAFFDPCNAVMHEQYVSPHNADDVDEPTITEVLEISSNEINGDASEIFPQSLQADIIYEHGDYASNLTLEESWLGGAADLDISIPEVEANVNRMMDSLTAELYNNNASSEGLLNTATMERFPGDYPGDHLSCSQMPSKCQSEEAPMDDLLSKGRANPALSPGSDIPHTPPTGSPSSLNDSTLINEEKPQQTDLRTDKNKPKKSVPVGKKRSRPDEIQRPRPRDRQLIQDRVKELRDLVPNANKCSIDALLDRTIKHMMFLRSVSSQAEKLRKCSRSKVVGPDREPLEFEDENYGLTWAYELDSQPEACPIVVKDLDQQGHMLVEMLCTEYADFLEIAQVMRRLRLTILKGVMESRSEKLWAHFIVEATKGFNRMEILWPLMQLLQKNRIPLTSRF